MLALIRRFAKTWPARLLFGGLVAAFGLWGVAGRLTNPNGDTAVAVVGSTRVELPDAQRAFVNEMAQVTKSNPGDQSPALRRQVADQAVRQLVLQAVLGNEIKRLKVATPDAAVRGATFAMPAFAGTGGSFDKATFLSVLAHNGLDEPRFLKLVRDDVGRQQLIGALEAGAAAPGVLVEQLYTLSHETRTAAAVRLKLASAAAPPAPTDAQLRRFWTNNAGLYATPEYRRIKVVVLSPQTIARDLLVSDDDIKAYYASARANYDKPERRSLQVLSAPDLATAARLATAWQAGADWASIQAQSSAAGATALDLADAKQLELPDKALGRAAFAATPNMISQPLNGDFGWFAFKVTKVTPRLLVTLDQARSEIHDKIGVLKANDMIDDRANKIEDALAGGGALDTLPSGLGVAAVEGTLDAQGLTPAGAAAPLPANPALRQAIIASAFKIKPGEAPHLEQLAASKENPGGGYYALTVNAVTPPSHLSYEAVADRVRQDWVRQQQRRALETAAAQLLAATRAGTSLASAASAKGLSAQTLPPVPRPLGGITPTLGVPDALVAPLFGLKPGEATMVETPDGFVVAQLQSVNIPSATSDSIGVEQVREELTRSVSSDLTNLFVQSLQHGSTVTLNEKLIAQIAQP